MEKYWVVVGEEYEDQRVEEFSKEDEKENAKEMWLKQSVWFLELR
jgi:hypothetical protein